MKDVCKFVDWKGSWAQLCFFALTSFLTLTHNKKTQLECHIKGWNRRHDSLLVWQFTFRRGSLPIDSKVYGRPEVIQIESADFTELENITNGTVLIGYTNEIVFEEFLS